MLSPLEDNTREKQLRHSVNVQVLKNAVYNVECYCIICSFQVVIAESEVWIFICHESFTGFKGIA